MFLDISVAIIVAVYASVALGGVTQEEILPLAQAYPVPSAPLQAEIVPSQTHRQLRPGQQDLLNRHLMTAAIFERVNEIEQFIELSANLHY